MTGASTRSIIDSARGQGIGIAALNVIQIEHAQAILAAAEELDRPVILQLSENAIRYHGGIEAIAAACRAAIDNASVEAVLHLDHAESFELCLAAADAGFDSVMIDAAHLPWNENVALTARVASWGRDRGLWVEAELGEVGGKGAHVTGARTHPGEAADFVARTGVDGLAVAIGSSHAMLSQDAVLDYGLLAAIRARVEAPLVLHGSSGVSDEGIASAIRGGITKVNVSTQLNIAMSETVRRILVEDGKLADPRKYLGPARSAVQQRAAELISLISHTQ